MLLSVIDHLLNCIGDTRGSSCRRTEALVTTNRLVSTYHQRSQISLGDNRPMHLLNSAGGWPACSFLPNRIKPSRGGRVGCGQSAQADFEGLARRQIKQRVGGIIV